ncbi:MAG: ABC transporter ATP-binding protein, partial [Acidimicrobiia bacterium]|nr:ABC transporter ATP-binding protein [Acidimicrobiia bacterium]
LIPARSASGTDAGTGQSTPHSSTQLSRSSSPHRTVGDLPGRATVIAANGAAKVFASGDGIRDLDLSVHEGTILGLIGPSGSGKTTAVKMFTGGIVPSSGSVRVFGSDPVGFSAFERARIGYMPQRSVLYPTLTVEENLDFLSSLYGKHEPSRMSEVLDFVELSEHVDKRADEISGGMQRRLSLAGALAHNPDLLFLDEPTAGIDPVLRRKFWDRFTELKEQGRTLLVTTQYVGEAAYCDYIGVLADGDLVTVDTPEGLRRTAYGGDLIDVEFTSRPNPADVQDLQQALGATSSTSTSPVSIRFVVPEAAAAVPLLGTWSGERRVEIELAEQHVPSFDDVFVEIVEQARIDGGEEA